MRTVSPVGGGFLHSLWGGRGVNTFPAKVQGGSRGDNHRDQEDTQSTWYDLMLATTRNAASSSSEPRMASRTVSSSNSPSTAENVVFIIRPWNTRGSEVDQRGGGSLQATRRRKMSASVPWCSAGMKGLHTHGRSNLLRTEIGETHSCTGEEYEFALRSPRATHEPQERTYKNNKGV